MTSESSVGVVFYTTMFLSSKSHGLTTTVFQRNGAVAYNPILQTLSGKISKCSLYSDEASMLSYVLQGVGLFFFKSRLYESAYYEYKM